MVSLMITCSVPTYVGSKIRDGKKNITRKKNYKCSSHAVDSVFRRRAADCVHDNNNIIFLYYYMVVVVVVVNGTFFSAAGRTHIRTRVSSGDATGEGRGPMSYTRYPSYNVFMHYTAWPPPYGVYIFFYTLY